MPHLSALPRLDISDPALIAQRAVYRVDMAGTKVSAACYPKADADHEHEHRRRVLCPRLYEYQVDDGIPHAAVMLETGKTTNVGMREMILDASQKLGLRHLVWID